MGIGICMKSTNISWDCRDFSLAGVSICLCYTFQLTVFLPCLALNARRAQGYWDGLVGGFSMLCPWLNLDVKSDFKKTYKPASWKKRYCIENHRTVPTASCLHIHHNINQIQPIQPIAIWYMIYLHEKNHINHIQNDLWFLSNANIILVVLNDRCVDFF